MKTLGKIALGIVAIGAIVATAYVVVTKVEDKK